MKEHEHWLRHCGSHSCREELPGGGLSHSSRSVHSITFSKASISFVRAKVACRNLAPFKQLHTNKSDSFTQSCWTPAKPWMKLKRRGDSSKTQVTMPVQMVA